MKRIRRMDGVPEEVTKPVEVSKLVSPKFLTLTERPANQVAFKIVRDDSTGENTMASKEGTAPAPQRQRRIRSTQRSALLVIEFPEDTTDEDVKSFAEEYGLTDYEVSCTADGRKCLKRSDLTDIPDNSFTVLIGDGRKACILRTETQPAPNDPQPYIEVASIEFDTTQFPSETSVMEYLQRYDIDFLEKGVENTDKLIRVARSEVSDDMEVRRVQVETGVVAVVTRSAQEVTLVPSPFTEVVCEECYGQWGWGQLDFTAMMADIEFCEAADDASYRLRNLVERILFYSQLPISARKELVKRACSQFADFIGSLLDGLPAKVVLVNRSNLEKRKEKQSMPEKTDDKAQQTAATATGAAPEAEAPITRSEIATMISDGIKTALAAQASTAATPAAIAPEGAATDVARSDDGVQNTDAAKMLASVEALTATVKGLSESVGTVVARMDTMEGGTTVRSDGKDSVQAAPTADVFSGIFAAGRKRG